MAKGFAPGPHGAAKSRMHGLPESVQPLAESSHLSDGQTGQMDGHNYHNCITK